MRSSRPIRQPPRPAGRGKAERPTAVEVRARGAGDRGAVARARCKGAEEQAAFAALDADVAVVAAYGLILPQAILDAPTLGCLNVHGSLLPRWRGAAPVQRAIMAGDEVTGVTIMQMEAGLDTGPMLLKREVAIDDKNAAQLTEELAELGAAMMVEVLADLRDFAADAAARGGRHLRRQDRQGRSADRLVAAGGRDRAAGAGPRALPRRLVRGRRASGSSCSPPTSVDGSGAPGEVLDDRADDRLRRRRAPPDLLQRAGAVADGARRIAARLRRSRRARVLA